MKKGSAVIGIGCFAGRKTLLRVFQKALESFILGTYDDICPEVSFNDARVTRFFKSVIQSGKKKPDQIDRALRLFSDAVNITGFFLGLNNRSLCLILFFQDRDHQQTKFITRLEKFDWQRNKRLH